MFFFVMANKAWMNCYVSCYKKLKFEYKEYWLYIENFSITASVFPNTNIFCNLHFFPDCKLKFQI